MLKFCIPRVGSCLTRVICHLLRVQVQYFTPTAFDLHFIKQNIGLIVSDQKNLNQFVEWGIAPFVLFLGRQVDHIGPSGNSLHAVVEENQSEDLINETFPWSDFEIPRIVENFSEIMMSIHHSYHRLTMLEVLSPDLRQRLKGLLNQPQNCL